MSAPFHSLLSLWGRHLYPASRWECESQIGYRQGPYVTESQLWTGISRVGFNHYIVRLTWTERRGGKEYLGRKERILQGRFPFLLSAAFLFSGHQHDQTSWKNMHLLPVKPIPFLPLSGDHKRANGDSNIPPNSRKWKCLWKVGCISMASSMCLLCLSSGLHNLLILWHPTFLEVAHLYFQQFCAHLCVPHLFYQTRTIAYHWIPYSFANSYSWNEYPHCQALYSTLRIRDQQDSILRVKELPVWWGQVDTVYYNINIKPERCSWGFEVWVGVFQTNRVGRTLQVEGEACAWKNSWPESGWVGETCRTEGWGKLGKGGPGRAQQMLVTEQVPCKCFLHEKIHCAHFLCKANGGFALWTAQALCAELSFQACLSHPSQWEHEHECWGRSQGGELEQPEGWPHHEACSLSSQAAL